MPVVPGAAGGERVALEEVPGGRSPRPVHVGPYHEIGACLRRRPGLDGASTGGSRAGMVRETYLNDPDSVPAEELAHPDRLGPVA